LVLETAQFTINAPTRSSNSAIGSAMARIRGVAKFILSSANHSTPKITNQHSEPAIRALRTPYPILSRYSHTNIISAVWTMVSQTAQIRKTGKLIGATFWTPGRAARIIGMTNTKYRNTSDVLIQRALIAAARIKPRSGLCFIAVGTLVMS